MSIQNVRVYYVHGNINLLMSILYNIAYAAAVLQIRIQDGGGGGGGGGGGDDLLILAIFRYWRDDSQISQNSLIIKLCVMVI